MFEGPAVTGNIPEVLDNGEVTDGTRVTAGQLALALTPYAQVTDLAVNTAASGNNAAAIQSLDDRVTAKLALKAGQQRAGAGNCAPGNGGGPAGWSKLQVSNNSAAPDSGPELRLLGNQSARVFRERDGGAHQCELIMINDEALVQTKSLSTQLSLTTNQRNPGCLVIAGNTGNVVLSDSRVKTEIAEADVASSSSSSTLWRPSSTSART